MSNKKLIFKPSNRGNALIFVIVFIVIATIGVVSVVRSSGNQRENTRNQSEQMLVEHAAYEALDLVKSHAMDSISYFSDLRRLAVTSAQIDALESLFRRYARAQTYQSFLNTEESSGGRRLSEFFIDFARRNGFRTGLQDRVVTSDNIKYEFSLRCVKDERYAGDQATSGLESVAAYWRGDFDGCPVEFRDGDTVSPALSRGISNFNQFKKANWSVKNMIGDAGQLCVSRSDAGCSNAKSVFENWIRLPKKLEIVVSARRGNTVATVREIAEAEPIVLNDYAFLLGEIRPPAVSAGGYIKPNQRYNIFGSQVFGRMHIDQQNELPRVCTIPNWDGNSDCSGEGNSEPYRVVVNAEKQSFVSTRAFTTTANAPVDAMEFLNGNDSIPLRTNSTSIRMLGGYSSDAPRVNVVDKVNTALLNAENIPGAVVFNADRGRCTMTPRGTNMHIVCPQGGSQTVNIANGAKTLVFKGGLDVNGGNIKGGMAVYTPNSDLKFNGSVHYNLAIASEDDPDLNQDLAFIPFLDENPDPNQLRNPMSIDQPGAFRSVNEDQQSYAMWVAQKIVIDATVAKPMRKLTSSGNGVFYQDARDGDGSLVQQAQAIGETSMTRNNQSQMGNALDRMTIIDGKLQSAEGLAIKKSNTGTPADFSLEDQNNYGALVLRGGLTLGEAPVLRRVVNNSLNRGFNNVFSAFDGRSIFGNIQTADQQVQGQVNWSTISVESTSGRGLFGEIENRVFASVGGVTHSVELGEGNQVSDSSAIRIDH